MGIKGEMCDVRSVTPPSPSIPNGRLPIPVKSLGRAGEVPNPRKKNRCGPAIQEKDRLLVLRAEVIGATTNRNHDVSTHATTKEIETETNGTGIDEVIATNANQPVTTRMSGEERGIDTDEMNMRGTTTNETITKMSDPPEGTNDEGEWMPRKLSATPFRQRSPSLSRRD